MQQLTVGEIKSQFSDVLVKVTKGESFTITFGKNKKKIAALIPFEKHVQEKPITLGLLEGKASFTIHDNFSFTDEELIKA